MKQSYSVRDPYLKNHKIHDFHESLQKEKNIVSKGDHLKVIHALNLEFEKKGLSIDFDSFEDNYGSDAKSQFKNKAGVDATFNIVNLETRKIVKEGYTIDYKFRDPTAKWDDFLAETVSQDFGKRSGKMPVLGWAVAPHKINDGVLYIQPYHKKATLIGRKELKAGFDNDKFPRKPFKYARNRGWTTINMPIDWDVIMKVCPATMQFKYE